MGKFARRGEKRGLSFYEKRGGPKEETSGERTIGQEKRPNSMIIEGL